MRNLFCWLYQTKDNAIELKKKPNPTTELGTFLFLAINSNHSLPYLIVFYVKKSRNVFRFNCCIVRDKLKFLVMCDCEPRSALMSVQLPLTLKRFYFTSSDSKRPRSNYIFITEWSIVGIRVPYRVSKT